MAGMRKHIGKLINSDRRCVIVYMQIPSRESHALIIDTDSLPDHFHQALMDVVESESAQTTTNLADVLDRRASPDSGLNLMNSFHQRGYMRPERIENIVMLPMPNKPFPLSKIIESINQNKPASTQNKLPKEPENNERYNQYTENINANNRENKMAIAQSILYDAKLLEEQVIRKRNQAYELMPSLRPSSSFLVEEPNQFSTSSYVDDISPEEREILRRAQEDLDRSLANNILVEEPIKKSEEASTTRKIKATTTKHKKPIKKVSTI